MPKPVATRTSGPDPNTAPHQPLGLSLQWAVAGLVLPALSYLLAYSVLLGEATHLGIPIGFVTVSLGDVLEIALIVGGPLVYLSLALRGLTKNLTDSGSVHPALERLISPFVVAAVIALAIWWAFGPGPALWLTLGFLALLALLTLAHVVSAVRKHGSVPAALDAINGEPADPDILSPRYWSTVVRAALNLHPVALLTLLFGVFYLSGLGQLVGIGIVTRQTEYLVPQSPPSHVVLLINSGHAVLGRVSPEDPRLLVGEYQVKDFNSLGPVTLSQIGTLRTSK